MGQQELAVLGLHTKTASYTKMNFNLIPATRTGAHVCTSSRLALLLVATVALCESTTIMRCNALSLKLKLTVTSKAEAEAEATKTTKAETAESDGYTFGQGDIVMLKDSVYFDVVAESMQGLNKSNSRKYKFDQGTVCEILFVTRLGLQNKYDYEVRVVGTVFKTIWTKLQPDQIELVIKRDGKMVHSAFTREASPLTPYLEILEQQDLKIERGNVVKMVYPQTVYGDVDYLMINKTETAAAAASLPSDTFHS